MKFNEKLTNDIIDRLSNMKTDDINKEDSEISEDVDIIDLD